MLKSIQNNCHVFFSPKMMKNGRFCFNEWLKFWKILCIQLVCFPCNSRIDLVFIQKLLCNHHCCFVNNTIASKYTYYLLIFWNFMHFKININSKSNIKMLNSVLNICIGTFKPTKKTWLEGQNDAEIVTVKKIRQTWLKIIDNFNEMKQHEIEYSSYIPCPPLLCPLSTAIYICEFTENFIATYINKFKLICIY